MPIHIPIEWDRPLSRRRGSPWRLGGLEIYYDFNWRSVFFHNRAVFPNGQSLARLAKRDCPEGKRPTLLLTERDDVVARIEQTEDRYVVIVPIRDYLRDAGGDAASTYYARLSGAPLTQLPSLAEVSFSASELEGFLDENLTPEALANWADESPDRLHVLQEITGLGTPALPEDVIQGIRGLTLPDLRVLDEVVEYLDRFDGDIGLRGLLARVTRYNEGRMVAAQALAERLPERISDTRGQLDQYQELITTDGVTETDVQQFLERNPWIVGLPYVGARARVEIPRGEIDFVLDRYDGFFDIVELKGPDDPIVTERSRSGSGGDRPPPGSAYSLGPALANAIAQAHLYRSILDRSRDLQREYGLADSRQPRILILLGRSTDLSVSCREILRELNLTLHRVEVIPYDLLGLRTAGFLDNIEALLSDV